MSRSKRFVNNNRENICCARTQLVILHRQTEITDKRELFLGLVVLMVLGL